MPFWRLAAPLICLSKSRFLSLHCNKVHSIHCTSIIFWTASDYIHHRYHRIRYSTKPTWPRKQTASKTTQRVVLWSLLCQSQRVLCSNSNINVAFSRVHSLPLLHPAMPSLFLHGAKAASSGGRVMQALLTKHTRGGSILLGLGVGLDLAPGFAPQLNLSRDLSATWSSASDASHCTTLMILSFFSYPSAFCLGLFRQEPKAYSTYSGPPLLVTPSLSPRPLSKLLS